MGRYNNTESSYDGFKVKSIFTLSKRSVLVSSQRICASSFRGGKNYILSKTVRLQVLHLHGLLSATLHGLGHYY